MADKTVRIENMPQPQDSGSPERVAYDLWRYMKKPFERAENAVTQKNQLLDLYAECLRATQGLRKLD